jgi:hypothetical protein
MANCVCACGECRVCKQRATRQQESRSARRLRIMLRDAEIEASGPHLRLSCQMIEDYAKFFADEARLGDCEGRQEK